MKQAHKRLLAAVLVVVILGVGFTGGYWTAKYHYLNYMNEAFNVMRDGRPWYETDKGIIITPNKRSG